MQSPLKLREFTLLSLWGAGTMALLALADLVVARKQPSLLTSFGGVGVAAGLGFVLGSASAALLTLLRRLALSWSRWGPRIGYTLIAAVVAASVILPMRPWQELGGKDEWLAWLLMFGCLGAGAGISWLFSLLSRARPASGRIGEGKPLRRSAEAIGVLVVVGSTLGLDRYAYPDRYEPVHLLLRLGTWLAVFSGLLTLLGRHAELPRRRLNLALSLTGGFTLLGFVLLDRTEPEDMGALLDPALARLPVELFRAWSDLDGDGFASVLGGADCRAWDSSVNPGAEELPGNGVDDNCSAGDFLGERPRPGPLAAPPTAPSPLSVVLITIDTLRADRMSVYGAERDTTPRLRRWASSALRFDHAYTPATYTSLALSSLFRGVLPRRLEWTWVFETNRLRLLQAPVAPKLRSGERALKAYTAPVHDEWPTLAELLKHRGMRTGAVVDDGGSSFLDHQLNIGGKFDRYELMDERPHSKRDDRGVTERAVHRLRQWGKKPRPFLLWVHYFGPHVPVEKHPGVPEFGSGVEDRYDHEVAYTDRWVGRLLEEVDRVAQQRELAVVITADHGERLRGGPRSHGNNLDLNTLHVPLLMRGPGFEPGTYAAPVSTLDLFATILQWTETPSREGMDSRSLLSPPDPHPVLAETWRFSRTRKPFVDKLAVLDATMKLEWDLTRNTQGWYDVTGADQRPLTGRTDSEQYQQLRAAAVRYLEENRRVRISE